MDENVRKFLGHIRVKLTFAVIVILHLSVPTKSNLTEGGL